MNIKETWINQAIHYLIAEDPFKGNLLQECDIQFTTMIPTAALYFSPKTLKYTVELNPEFFEKLPLKQRIAILKHEMLHFLNGHLFRFEKFTDPKEGKLNNIACDMAVNQFINDLPEGCIKVEDWKGPNGSNLLKYQTSDYYLNVLKETTNQPKDEDKEGEGQGTENWDQYSKFAPFDEHRWSDEEKQAALEAAKNALKRTVEKTSFSFNLLPDYVEDIFKLIDEKLYKINYKSYLKWAIKKHLAAEDRKNTWNRPNKRYYNYAPGSTNDKLPFLNVYIDTSGSISHKEMTEFYLDLKEWLKNSGKRCNLLLWHTSIYHQQKFNMIGRFDNLPIQSGGTEVREVLEHIEKHNPDLSLILTDGYYDYVKMVPKNKIIWIISKMGNKAHPLKNIGKTVRLE